MIGDIVQTYFNNQKYHGIFSHVSGDFYYVVFFDGINSLPLPIHYSLLTKVSE